jgi:cytochrome P450
LPVGVEPSGNELLVVKRFRLQIWLGLASITSNRSRVVLLAKAHPQDIVIAASKVPLYQASPGREQTGGTMKESANGGVMSKRGLAQLKILIAVTRARIAALTAGGQLAPGALTAEDDRFREDQFTLIKKRRQIGDVFKIWWNGKITTCMVGHASGKKFLTDNRDSLRVATIDLTALFPHGFLRSMEGETHATYRKLIVAAFRAVPLESRENQIREVIQNHISTLAAGYGKPSSALIARTAKQATTALMLELILGIQHDNPIAEEITRVFEDYAPDGMPKVVREKEQRCYETLKGLVRNHIAQNFGQDRPPQSLLEYVVKNGALDDTVLGNLIQMTEFGRYDVHGLWRWILHEIAGQSDYLRRISDEPDPQTRRSMSESIAHEMLRMQQSEYIYRSATKTFTYRGLLVPKRSRVRICVWEGHRDPAKFPEPNRFVPDRFVKNKYQTDVYAPFGLDHHRCLGANWTITLSALLVESVAEHYNLSLQQYGTPVYGHFHFEPGPDAKATWTAKATA